MSSGGQGSSGFPSTYSGQSNFGSSPNYGGYGGSPNYFPQYQPQNSGYPNRFAAFGASNGSAMGDPNGGALMDAGMPSRFPSYMASMNGNGMGGMGNGMSDIMSAPDSGMPQQAPQVSAPQAPQSSQGMYQPQGNGAPAGYTYDQNGSLISNALAAQAGVQPNYGPGAPQPDPQAQAKGITLSEGPKLGNFNDGGQSWLYGPTAGMFGAARPQGTPNNYWYNQNAGQWGPLTPQVR